MSKDVQACAKQYPRSIPNLAASCLNPGGLRVVFRSSDTSLMMAILPLRLMPKSLEHHRCPAQQG